MDRLVKVRTIATFSTDLKLTSMFYRNFELIKVQRKDLREGCDLSCYSQEYAELHLVNRKGWMRRMDKGVLETDLCGWSPSVRLLRKVAWLTLVVYSSE